LFFRQLGIELLLDSQILRGERRRLEITSEGRGRFIEILWRKIIVGTAD
jgi:hypothetical protein